MIASDRKVALVTGGGRGIGRAIAERLAADGAVVAINYVSDAEAAADAVRAISKAGGQAFTIQADITSLSSIATMFQMLDIELTDRGHAPGLDILVNNAGVSFFGAIAATDEAVFDRVVGANLKGAFFVARTALERMNAGGRIIMISSAAGTKSTFGLSIYAATKAALNSLTESFALEGGVRGITVNAVAPGYTTTDLNRAQRRSTAIVDAIAAKTLLGRWGAPIDIAVVVAFLAGPDAGWVTGQVIEASGGFGVAH